MKSSLFVVAASAILATAGPLRMRALTTDWVTEIVTVTVTEDDLQPTPAIFKETQKVVTTSTPPPAPVKPKATISSIPPPPPPPKPTAAAEPKPKVITTPAPAKPSTVASPPPTNKPSDYKSTMLKHHNDARAKHSAGPLEWDNDLAQSASTLANTCVFGHDLKPGGGGYGQNIAAASTTDTSNGQESTQGSKAVTDMWYLGEIKFYANSFGRANPLQLPSDQQTGHFTQVVWKATTKLGCATVKCNPGTALRSDTKNYSWYTVCNYKSPGNVGGQYATNVLAA
ncbi:putative effector 14 [Metarhizium rileyi]|uniref:Effector 14 n=1 Tax=Metarhizium rileyi (strain RCEF 4871) TaxID=1649241 RepID=A0A167BH98_METRR|nr:putative effector 14 [Metarhizium rileyi RCEF 4871]TWU72999.1 hypothetical protein ED733_004709 [Metarhizium rileyi]